MSTRRAHRRPDSCPIRLARITATTILPAIFLTAAGAALVAQEGRPPARPPSNRPLALVHATVIEGSGAPPRHDMTVIVRNGRIDAILRSRDVDPEPDTTTIDARGKFVIPGLIDTHAHVTYLDWSPDSRGDSHGIYNEEVSLRSLRLLLASGITSVRNTGGPTLQAVSLRDGVNAGVIEGPRILTAGEILNRAPRFDGLTRPVSSTADIEREVAAQKADGVDLIKIYGNLPPELVAAAVTAAHSRGLRVAGHLQATSWTEAARLGIDAICHGASWAAEELPADRRDAYRRAIAEKGAMRARMDWLDRVDPAGREIQAMIGELRRRRIAVDPTLIAYATKFRGRDSRYINSPDIELAPPTMRSSFPSIDLVRDWAPEDFAQGRRVWPRMQALIRAYHSGGVLLTAGSDEPNAWIVPGPGLHTELELLVEAGLSSLEVLTIATRNGAEALGLLDTVGTVSVGKEADLLVLDRDPTQRIRHSRSIAWVVKRGVLYRPADVLAAR